MKPKEVCQQVEYWIKTAEHDFETMTALFKSGRYSDCLFFGHIILEKILKAHVVKTTKKSAPKIHNLIRLQEIAGLDLSRNNWIC